MAKQAYRTQFNYKVGEGREENIDESMTIPGESKTVKELLEQTVAGNPAFEREPVYFDTDDQEVMNYLRPGLDLTELDELREINEAQHEAILKAQQKRDDEEKKKLADEILAEEVEKKIAEAVAAREKETDDK